ncbi:unnamed protein product [Diamesa serratosioi]
MSKPTTIKEALTKWEEREGIKVTEAMEIELQFQFPPIDKMTADLSTLANCVKLSLSTNQIDRIAGLSPNMKHLKILALGRNNIKSLNGLEAVADTLEELWISYNIIEKLKGIEQMKKLKVLYIAYNNVRDWKEFSILASLHGSLEDLIFLGNPLAESMEENAYHAEAIRRLPFLKKLDGEPIVSMSTDDE